MKEWVEIVVHSIFAYFLMTGVMLVIYLIGS